VAQLTLTLTISSGKDYGTCQLSLGIRHYSGELLIKLYLSEVLLVTKAYNAPSGALGVYKGKKPLTICLWSAKG
jgi:hypothetical protein